MLQQSPLCRKVDAQYVDAGYCYTFCGMVCLSVTLVSLTIMVESIEMPFSVWAHVTMRSRSPTEKGNFGVGRGGLWSNYFDLLF